MQKYEKLMLRIVTYLRHIRMGMLRINMFKISLRARVNIILPKFAFVN